MNAPNRKPHSHLYSANCPECTPESTPEPKVHIRYLKQNGIHYLRAEDVANYIREMAGGEETDVRNRLLTLAANLEK